MNASRLLLVAALLAGTASFLTAGPGPQFWIRPLAPKTPAAATAEKTAPAPMTHAACATTSPACACCSKA